jgi:hypothetical protein
MAVPWSRPPPGAFQAASRVAADGQPVVGAGRAGAEVVGGAEFADR